MRTASVGLLVLVAVACADDSRAGVETTTSTTVASTTTGPDTVTTAPTAPATTPVTTEPATTTTTEPEIEIPDGILAAMPTQNRVDPAKGQFQVKLINRSGEALTVTGVQFVWDGYTTPLTERRVLLTGNRRVDVPVAFPGARCAGDGTLATMPDLGGAVVRLVLEDGSEREAPVYDVDHLARRLYLDDCERQMIERRVAVEWIDLRAGELEGRPVTEGTLRLTRGEATGTVTVLSVSNTINFTFESPASPPGTAIVTLAADQDVASAPVRFVEGRCDPHAIAESSQPFKFIAQIDLDGVLHPYVVTPPVEEQAAMRIRVEAGCQQLGKTEFLDR